MSDGIVRQVQECSIASKRDTRIVGNDHILNDAALLTVVTNRKNIRSHLKCESGHNCQVSNGLFTLQITTEKRLPGKFNLFFIKVYLVWIIYKVGDRKFECLVKLNQSCPQMDIKKNTANLIKWQYIHCSVVLSQSGRGQSVWARIRNSTANDIWPALNFLHFLR